MAQIETLVEDINTILVNPHIIEKLNVENFSKYLENTLTRQLLNGKSHELRMSMLGSKCDRELQYKCDPNAKGEALAPDVKMKFMFGDLIEALVLLLAREAGHTVEGEQDELVIAGVIGHRDAIIDGMVVDVKSASSMGFKKFKNHLSFAEDSFGYIDQLGSYLYASQSDQRVLRKRHAAFLAVDKQFGHICLDIHSFDPLPDYERLVHEKQVLLRRGIRANRGYFDEPDGKSGNRKLGTKCSYCSFKTECWPGLQTYLYSNGPRFLTRVEREPEVERIS